MRSPIISFVVCALLYNSYFISILTTRGTIFTGIYASKAKKAWTRLQPLLNPPNAVPANELKTPASAASAPGSFRNNDPVRSDFGTAIPVPIVGILSARVCDTLRETLAGFELIEGKPEYSVKCLDIAVWSARSFAQSKIANDGKQHASPSPTDVNGLTLKQVGAINLYSQEGAFYLRLNALLNAKKNRSQRLHVRVSVYALLFNVMQILVPFSNTHADVSAATNRQSVCPALTIPDCPPHSCNRSRFSHTSNCSWNPSPSCQSTPVGGCTVECRVIYARMLPSTKKVNSSAGGATLRVPPRRMSRSVFLSRFVFYVCGQRSYCTFDVHPAHCFVLSRVPTLYYPLRAIAVFIHYS